MDDYKFIELENGNKVQIKFEQEGIVYDIVDKNYELIEERGFDLYHEDIPVKRV